MNRKPEELIFEMYKSVKFFEILCINWEKLIFENVLIGEIFRNFVYKLEKTWKSAFCYFPENHQLMAIWCFIIHL
jgi:hypothetical protein